MTPIGDKILLKLDPEVRISEGAIYMPDEDSIRICKKCGNMMENLAKRPCVVQDVFDNDEYHDRPRFRGTHQEHDIEVIYAPTLNEITRTGTVVEVGRRVKSVMKGDRVLVGHTSGGSTDDVRVIRECELLGMVEEEAA